MAGLRARCAAIFGKHKVPRYVWFFDEPLLRNVSGNFLMGKFLKR